ncbi:MAG: transporter, partial [Candidatus Glassbacteria bacterium]|nr:transporter [Candidatus Glassbacteria bacterium]
GAGIVPTGTLQLEGGYRYSRVGPDKMHTLGEALLRVAPAEKLELRIGVNSYLVSRSPGGDDSGFGDGSLALKYKLLQRGEGMGAVDLSTILGTTLPTGSEIYRENKLQPWTQLILEWNINGDVVLSYNFYYGLASSSGDQYNTFGSGIAFSFPLADRLGCFLEYYGIAVEKGYGENTSYLDGGITWLLSNNLQVDIHSGAGLGETDPNYFVGVGLSFNWGL